MAISKLMPFLPLPLIFPYNVDCIIAKMKDFTFDKMLGIGFFSIILAFSQFLQKCDHQLIKVN
jgi:hypothetical protein